MALGPRLEFRQTQSLVMTPQLQQAIKLLQLSNLELAAFVEQELEQNPLLERADSDGSPEAGAVRGTDGERLPGEAGTPPAGDVAATGGTGTDTVLDGGGEAGATALDTEYENVWGEDSGTDSAPDAVTSFADWGPGGRATFDGEGPDLENLPGERPTLRAHLREQLGTDLRDPVDRLIGACLIDLLDETGYLGESTAAVAAALGCPESRVAAVLARLQQFDPPGVFARNLGECLALQLHDRGRLTPPMRVLLEHLPLLAARDLAALRRLCGVDGEALGAMIAEIRRLDPKPGLVFGDPPAPPVTPDVMVRPAEDGGWIVELNTETLPRVLVNREFHARVTRDKPARPAREYLAERLQSANWLVKSLQQRANTILKVAVEIVRQQDGFLRHGVQHLRPLVLRDIATAIDMHESTVSRVTANKYIATPRGLYELKYFFSSALASSAGGEAHSAEAVRFRIKSLIDAESPQDVLSDDRIVEMLRGDGIEIARRTVAKYREALRIASSVQRRREKLGRAAEAGRSVASV